MQIVIDIPKELYEALLSGYEEPYSRMFSDVVKNGTPLPKGHGRLIDADKTALLSDLFCYTKYTGIDEAPYEDATKALEFAPTIIEAYKAESEEISERNMKMWREIFKAESEDKEWTD